MPGRPLFFDLRCRNDAICRACLSSIRRQPTQPWSAPYSSQAGGRQRSRARQAVRAPTATQPRNPDMEQYQQAIQELSALRQNGSGDYSVRFFEQSGKDRVQLRDEEAFDDSFNSLDIPSMKSEVIGAFKDDIKIPGGKNALQEVVDELNIDWDNLKTDEDMARARDRMDEYAASIDAQIRETSKGLPKEMLEELESHMQELAHEEEDMDRSMSRTSMPQIPESPWTMNQRKKISRLNAVIARVSRQIYVEGLTSKAVTVVFKAYHAARFSLAHGWNNVPIEVWDFLWKTISADESINSHRLSHIAVLARDMNEAKVPLTPPQQLVTIEALFVDGWEAKALENWRRCVSTLGDEMSETFQEYWELGVRMHCRMGNLEQAERAVNVLLEKQSDPRILMTMIRTHSEQGTAESQETAWNMYRQMRELLGQNMKLADYDQVVSYFLTTNQTENALYAFVDMMSDGQIDLKKQKFMPSVVANKFFLGKWLKRLIGAGNLSGAHEVVVFMRSKGVEAAPIHLNGLVGAWQRSGGVDDLAKADALAWQMIEARIRFVQARNSEAGASELSQSAAAPPPRANLETFSLLAENYRLRGLHTRLEELWEAFRKAEINADAFIMNQLLESYIQAGESKQALELYGSFVNDRGIVPDTHTFTALWKTLKINRLYARAGEASGKQTDETRALFAEMIRFKSVFEQEGMDGQLARKVLHTFRRLKDHGGLIIALATLKRAFGFLPPETLVLEMVLGTTRLKWDSPSERRGLMLAKRDLDRELLRWAGGDARKLEGAARGQALHQYLLDKFWPTGVASKDVDEVLQGVARQMGVSELLDKGKSKRTV